MSAQKTSPFREDIRRLGDVLGETLREQVGDAAYEQVERVRQLAKAAYDAQEDGIGDGACSAQYWQALIEYLARLSDSDLLTVTRAFSHFLNYANIAEQVHQVRQQRHQQAQSENVHHAVHGTIEELIPRLQAQGIEQKTLFKTLEDMQIELVLTAHPTEVTRRTLLGKYQDIYGILRDLDRQGQTPREQAAQARRLKRRVMAAWETDEIRKRKPTPTDEARWGFATIESTLWHAVPDAVRELDNQLFERTGQRLPPSVMPIRFASWMGGDRDGNPFVTAEVTAEVLLLARWQAADLMLRDVHQLRQDLSMHRCNPRMRARVGESEAEPYRVLLREIRKKLKATREWIEAKLDGQDAQVKALYADIYLNTEDILEPLELMYESLVDCGMTIVAQGTLLNLIRCVRCFGLSLLKLDIRQDSARHAAVIAEVCDYLKIVNAKGYAYLDWSEEEKQTFLLKELQGARPLFPSHFTDNEDVKEVLRTFTLLASQPAESLGAYIISMARLPSDVLTVKLLQRETGCQQPQRIVPLFETLEDLNRAPETLNALLSVDLYRDSIDGQQEIMIGYSDSAKGAGFLAAAWAQYQAQEGLLDVAKQHEVSLTFFHGRGGSVSRGGGPAHAALLSQPPGCLNKHVRVTEQGEVIQHKFGNPDIAVHSLELYLSATLEATLAPPPSPQPAWRDVMDQLSKTSVDVYRRTVYQDPRFMAYFKAVTPESELQKMSLGSRPAKRHNIDSIQSLRAIPWVFAWTQIRLMLPAWLGVGDALRALQSSGSAGALKQMWSEWPYFRMLMDMQEMVLSKADPAVVSYYQSRLLNFTDEKEQPALALGGECLESLRATVMAVSELTGQDVLDELPLLKQSIELRNPYMLPLHITQAEAMRRMRDESTSAGQGDGGDAREVLEQALLVSIAGIAAGLRNTG